jgi:hypothetical protein
LAGEDPRVDDEEVSRRNPPMNGTGAESEALKLIEPDKALLPACKVSDTPIALAGGADLPLSGRLIPTGAHRTTVTATGSRVVRSL